jgi:hypothetical protein
MTDLEMMRNPNSWPNLVLPMIRRETYPYDPMSKGVLWSPIQQDKATKWSFLRGAYLWDPIPIDAKWEHGGDELLIELIKDGWEID